MVAQAVAIGASLLGSALSFGGSKSAKRAAKRAAAEQARQERVVTEARIEQLFKEERSLAGTTVARQAGSGGVVNQGSVLQILKEQADEFRLERDTVRSAGASRVAVALAQGSSVASQASAQGLASLFQGIGQAVNIAYGAGLLGKK